MANCKSMYEVNGKILNTTELRQLIIDTLDNKKMTVREIEEALNLPQNKLSNVITTMSGNYLILVDNVRNSKRFVKYYNHPKSALQDIFHPLPKGYENMTGQVYKEKHAKHNNQMRMPYETFNMSSIYGLD